MSLSWLYRGSVRNESSFSPDRPGPPGGYPSNVERNLTDRRRARRTGPTLEALEGRHLLNSPSAIGTSINTGLAGLWGAAADTRNATGAFQITLTFNQGQDTTYLAQANNSDAAADLGDTWSQAWGDVFAARSLETQATADYQAAAKVSDPLAGQLVQAGNAKMEQAKPLAQQA